jgi:CRP/FNR family transcriptional regulator, cyclic AMP receptor protein
MISPEILRRYPFFGIFSDSQLKSLAIISESISMDKGATLFYEGQSADKLFILMHGALDLINSVQEERRPENCKEYSVGEVNPGEPIGFSAITAPYTYTTTVRASNDSELIVIDADNLRILCQKDHDLAYNVLTQVNKYLLERLNWTRIQLAAAWA